MLYPYEGLGHLLTFPTEEISMTKRMIAVALLSVILTACASSQSQREERAGQRGDARLQGGFFAPPISLALAGMASTPDGLINISDVAAKAEAMFAGFDSDRSGSCSRGEQANWATAILGDPYASPTWVTLERDGNGAVSRGELTAVVVAAARRLDKDQDGILTRQEMLIRMPERSQRGGEGNRRGPGSEGKGRSPRSPRS